MARTAHIVSFEQSRRAKARASSRAPLPLDQAPLQPPADPAFLNASSARAASARTVPTRSSKSSSRGLKSRPAGRAGAKTARDHAVQQQVEEERNGRGFGARLADLRRSRAKSKADKTFSKYYGDTNAPSDASSAGPRAALYKGEMGSKHRQSSRMQAKHSEMSAPSAKIRGERKHGNRLLMVAGTIAACVGLTALFLYTPAQQYYQQLRERDRLEAEYQAVENRNAAIKQEVDALSIEAGVEDMARKEFGWVKPGENAVTVIGLGDLPDDSTFTAKIQSESIKPPETWYSPFLDPFFGVE